MSKMTATDMVDIITVSKGNRKMRPVSSRFPSTYARMYVMENQEFFEDYTHNGTVSNRGEAGDAIRAFAAENDVSVYIAFIVFADAYLAENNYEPFKGKEREKSIGVFYDNKRITENVIS